MSPTDITQIPLNGTVVRPVASFQRLLIQPNIFWPIIENSSIIRYFTPFKSVCNLAKADDFDGNQCLIVVHFVDLYWHWWYICFLYNSIFLLINPVGHIIYLLSCKVTSLRQGWCQFDQHRVLSVTSFPLNFRSARIIHSSLSLVSVSVKLSLSMIWCTYFKIKFICWSQFGTHCFAFGVRNKECQWSM